jgi:excisionase family DNA binding protein
VLKQNIWEDHMDPEFLTATEVAEYLRLPLSTVYKLVQDKRLPGFKVGKHWRFRKEPKTKKKRL